MMDGRQVKDRLNGQAEAVCRHLLPGGRREGHEWATGDVHDAKGRSLRVCLDGAKIGVWADFAEPGVKGSNLIELWMQVRGVDFRHALEEAKKFLGISDTAWRRSTGAEMVKESPRPKGTRRLEDELAPVEEGSPVWKWLTEVRRISPKAIRAYRVGEKKVRRTDSEGPDRNCVVFPFFDAEGNLVRLKFRDVDDKKYMFLHPSAKNEHEYEHGAPMLLFGIQATDPKYQRLFITEGELDAMAMYDYGNPAVSLPQGAQPSEREGKSAHDAWIQHDYPWLEAFLEIVLALDADIPGQQAVKILAPRLGLARCRLLDWPEGKKDANDCLMAGLEIMDALEALRSLDPEKLKRPRDFAKEIWEEFWPPDDKEPGDPMAFTMPFRWRDQEVTIWHGYSASGKSVCLGYVLMWLAAHFGRRACIASMEMPARKTFKNMMRQAMGRSKPQDEGEFRKALAWMDRFFFVYDHVGDAESEDVLVIFEYAARRYGVKHFVLDSLMKLSDVPFDGYDAQRNLVNRLCQLAADLKVHVHLVAHSRKPDQRHPEKRFWPDKHAVSGHGDITNGVHNVICIWRNRDKEEAIETAQYGNAEEREAVRQKWHDEEDTMLVVQKQRETGREPLKRLWFDAGESWQYRELPVGEPVGFMDEAPGEAEPEG